jgi:hypothetical protein
MIKKLAKLSTTRSFFLGLLLLTASALFVVPSVQAGNCFTDVPNGSFWSDYVCWLLGKGISTGYPDGSYRPDSYITRGETAILLQRALTTGDTHINTGPSGWVVNKTSSPGAYVEVGYLFTELRAAAAGTYMYTLSPSVPSSLYNTKMFIKSAKICYNATNAGAYITAIEVLHVAYHSTPPNYATIWYDMIDPTDLTNGGCRMVNFAGASSLFGNDQVSINISVTFTDPAKAVQVGSTTVILSPSIEYAVLDGDLLDPLHPSEAGTVTAPGE